MTSLVLCAGAPGALVFSAGAIAAEEVLPSPLRPAPGGVPGLTVGLALDEGLYERVKVAERVRLSAFMLTLQRTVDLDIERVDLLAPDAALAASDGERTWRLEAPDVVLLRGTVAGQARSQVFLSLSPHGSHGFIRVDGEGAGGAGEQTYIISTPPEGTGPTAIYNLTMLPDGTIQWLDFTCGVRDAMVAGARTTGPGRGGGSGTDNAPCRRIRVAIDTDWEYMERLGGNSAAAQAYIFTLLGAVNEIYVRDVNTHIQISYSRIWTAPGDPYTTTSIDDRLNEFRNHWNQTMQAVPRHVAHMLSGVRAGSGGVAWLGVLCPSTESYGISGYINGFFPYPLVNNHSQNWDVMVVAHELGHNFLAPHTHTMSPPVDICGSGNCTQAHEGTIMSYCHTCWGGMANIRLDLHHRVVNEHMSPYLNTLMCDITQAPAAITQHPIGRTVVTGQGTQLSAQAAGSGPLTYRWLRNGQALVDGAGVWGAATAVLTLNPANAAMAGEYRLRVTNLCGEAVSDPAIVNVLAGCYANCDRSTTAPILNIDDFTCFLQSYAEAQHLPHTQQVAHYANCDGSTAAPVLNVDDFTCFLTRYAAGCE